MKFLATLKSVFFKRDPLLLCGAKFSYDFMRMSRRLGSASQTAEISKRRRIPHLAAAANGYGAMTCEASSAPAKTMSAKDAAMSECARRAIRNPI